MVLDGSLEMVSATEHATVVKDGRSVREDRLPPIRWSKQRTWILDQPVGKPGASPQGYSISSAAPVRRGNRVALDGNTKNLGSQTTHSAEDGVRTQYYFL